MPPTIRKTTTVATLGANPVPIALIRKNTAAIFITENGMAFDDPVSRGGAVHDGYRIDFLQAHFEEAANSLADGVDLRGAKMRPWYEREG